MFISPDEEDYSMSLKRFESMLKTNKVFFFDSEEFEDIILHYLDSGKLHLAKKALKLGLEQHPMSSGLKLVQVEVLIFEDKLDAAEKLLNELQLMEPNNDEIYIQRATLFSKRDQHEMAIASLQQALEFTNDPIDVHNLLGMEYLFMDELELAKESFICCLEEDLEDQSALYNVVYCFEFLDQIEEAITFLESYTDKQPYSEIAWHQMGRLHYILKNYSAAVRAFEFATYIDDSFIGAFMEMGKALEKLNRTADAIACYKETIQLADATSYALLRLGKCYEKLKNHTEALKYYNRTVHEDPLLDKAWIAITDLYLKQKNYHKALHFTNKALEIDNENRYYWQRFAQINLALKKHEDAELGFTKAVTLGDLKLSTWLSWADMKLDQGLLEQASIILLQAFEFFPDHANICFRLSGIYFSLNHKENGTYHLKNALMDRAIRMSVLQQKFPEVWKMPLVQEIIARHLFE